MLPTSRLVFSFPVHCSVVLATRDLPENESEVGPLNLAVAPSPPLGRVHGPHLDLSLSVVFVQSPAFVVFTCIHLSSPLPPLPSYTQDCPHCTALPGFPLTAIAIGPGSWSFAFHEIVDWKTGYRLFYVTFGLPIRFLLPLPPSTSTSIHRTTRTPQ
jgi:hypothetical protein